MEDPSAFYESMEKGEIGFFNMDKRLALTDLDEETIADQICLLSGEYLTIKGDVLEELLAKPENLGGLAEFCVGILAISAHTKKETIKIHIDVDLENIPYHKSVWNKLVNFSGSATIYTSRWAKNLPLILKDWNLYLCQEIGGWLGSGYEWPRTAKDFDDHIASHLGMGLVLGNKKVVPLYRRYAEKDSDFKTGIKRNLAVFFNLEN